MTFAQATGQHRAPSALSSLTGSVGGGPDRNGQDRKASRTRRWSIIVWLVAFVVLVLNERGQIFFDTKLGVDIDPLGFYARLWHLWNPTQWFGTLQDQYIGYAFPMAPFYLAGQLLKVPIWVTERFWLSLLVAAGFAGLVKLAEAVRIGTDRSRVVAGLAFVLWPTFTILIGSTSAGILPGLLAPWAVLPLVSAATVGHWPGRLRGQGWQCSSWAVSTPRRRSTCWSCLPCSSRPSCTAGDGSCWPASGPAPWRWRRPGGWCRCCCRASTPTTSCPMSSNRRRRPGPCRPPRSCAARAIGPPTSILASRGCAQDGSWSPIRSPSWRRRSRREPGCSGCPAGTFRPAAGCGSASARPH